MIQFTLPLPPSINALFGGGSAQRRFPSKAYKLWMAAAPQLPPLMLDKVEMTYTYWFPDNRGRDCENYCKAIGDHLVKCGTILDDSWQHVSKLTLVAGGMDKAAPRVEITISAI